MDLILIVAGTVFLALGIAGLFTGQFDYGGSGNSGCKIDLLTGEANPYRDTFISAQGFGARILSLCFVLLGAFILVTMYLDHLDITWARNTKESLYKLVEWEQKLDDWSRHSNVRVKLN